MITRVADRFGIERDPTLAPRIRAIDPETATHHLSAFFGRPVELRAITVVKHKAGKRCLITYRIAQPNGGDRVVYAKMRAGKTDLLSHDLQRTLSETSFGPNAGDGIAVPPVLGTLPELWLWLQDEVAGVPATALCTPDEGRPIARRAADAIVKLHRTGPPSARRWTIGDELRVLRDLLDRTARARPALAAGIGQVLEDVEHLAQRIDPSPECGIHRDFYPDQLLIEGERSHLLDFDLYCEGEPALDAGNFLAHLTEQALRFHGCPNALAELEEAFRARFLAGSTAVRADTLAAFEAISLARHIHISTLFPERAATTEPLIELSRERLCAMPG